VLVVKTSVVIKTFANRNVRKSVIILAMVFIHQHRRKRVFQNLQPYPHNKFCYRLLDGVVSVVAVVAPFASLPQLLQIWIDHATKGVSLTTWSLFLFFNLPLLLYSIVHKDARLTTMYSIGTVINIFIVTGIILFG
jgi:uncharacterized protein with PQ loop repeat